MDDATTADMPKRADARRNRQRLLDAAVELILEVGGDPARDAVAARADVGIGTLYRHFPDRQQLLRAAALHALDRAIDAGEAALDDDADQADALRSYVHAAVDAGLGALNIIHPLLDDTSWPDRSSRAQSMVDRLVERARHDGRIGSEVTAQDVSLAVIRFCRPLAIGISPTEERAVAHRQIDVYLDGLAAAAR